MQYTSFVLSNELASPLFLSYLNLPNLYFGPVCTNGSSSFCLSFAFEVGRGAAFFGSPFDFTSSSTLRTEKAGGSV